MNKSMEMKNYATIEHQTNENLRLDLVQRQLMLNVRASPYTNQFISAQQAREERDSDEDSKQQSNENSNEYYSAREDRKSRNSGK